MLNIVLIHFGNVYKYIHKFTWGPCNGVYGREEDCELKRLAFFFNHTLVIKKRHSLGFLRDFLH